MQDRVRLPLCQSTLVIVSKASYLPYPRTTSSSRPGSSLAAEPADNCPGLEIIAPGGLLVRLRPADSQANLATELAVDKPFEPIRVRRGAVADLC